MINLKTSQMINYRIRPKGNYIKEANWEALYLLTENWKKDLEFYLFDIKFLEHLIENHFTKLLIHENLDELRELQIEVFELKNQCEYLLQCIQTNLESISKIINETYSHNTSDFRIENEQLEDDIQEFINNQREIRRVAFSMIRDVLESKNTKHVWMFN